MAAGASTTAETVNASSAASVPVESHAMKRVRYVNANARFAPSGVAIVPMARSRAKSGVRFAVMNGNRIATFVPNAAMTTAARAPVVITMMIADAAMATIVAGEAHGAIRFSETATADAITSNLRLTSELSIEKARAS